MGIIMTNIFFLRACFFLYFIKTRHHNSIWHTDMNMSLEARIAIPSSFSYWSYWPHTELRSRLSSRYILILLQTDYDTWKVVGSLPFFPGRIANHTRRHWKYMGEMSTIPEDLRWHCTKSNHTKAIFHSIFGSSQNNPLWFMWIS